MVAEAFFVQTYKRDSYLRSTWSQKSFSSKHTNFNSCTTYHIVTLFLRWITSYWVKMTTSVPTLHTIRVKKHPVFNNFWVILAMKCVRSWNASQFRPLQVVLKKWLRQASVISVCGNETKQRSYPSDSHQTKQEITWYLNLTTTTTTTTTTIMHYKQNNANRHHSF